VKIAFYYSDSILNLLRGYWKIIPIPIEYNLIPFDKSFPYIMTKPSNYYK